MDIHGELRKYLADNLLYVEDDYRYDNDASFIQEGLVDSMGIMELVTYVKGRFQIGVDQEDVIPDNFDSINKLAGFIERKRTQAGLITGPHATPGRTTRQPFAALG